MPLEIFQFTFIVTSRMNLLKTIKNAVSLLADGGPPSTKCVTESAATNGTLHASEEWDTSEHASAFLDDHRPVSIQMVLHVCINCLN